MKVAIAGGAGASDPRSRSTCCCAPSRSTVVVVCASSPLTENRSRSVYLADNAEIVGAIAERLAGRDGVLVAAAGSAATAGACSATR
jgi:malate/lactate dehydrogenase